MFAALQGNVDWEESNYWLNKINDLCRFRHLTRLFVIVPFQTQMLVKRESEYYPGIVSNLLEINGTLYLNPIEAFVNTHLDLVNKAERSGRRLLHSPLFNGHISDGHFSALGSELWATRVAARLELVLERNRLTDGMGGNGRSTSTSGPDG